MGVERRTGQERGEDGQDVVYLQGLSEHEGEDGERDFGHETGCSKGGKGGSGGGEGLMSSTTLYECISRKT